MSVLLYLTYTAVSPPPGVTCTGLVPMCTISYVLLYLKYALHFSISLPVRRTVCSTQSIDFHFVRTGTIPGKAISVPGTRFLGWRNSRRMHTKFYSNLFIVFNRRRSIFIHIASFRIKRYVFRSFSVA
jgi:hypothetical protein